MTISSPEPEVTAIVPAFNAAAHLPIALESLRAQTFARWEAVVVNDGSSDETGPVADSSAVGLCALSRFQHLWSDQSHAAVEREGRVDPAPGADEFRFERMAERNVRPQASAEYRAALRDALLERPPAIVVMDGYTEVTYARNVLLLDSLVQQRYERIATFHDGVMRVSVFLRLEQGSDDSASMVE